MRLKSLKMLVQIQQWSHSGTGMMNAIWIELLVLGFCGCQVSLLFMFTLMLLISQTHSFCLLYEHPNICVVYSVYLDVINLSFKQELYF